MNATTIQTVDNDSNKIKLFLSATLAILSVGSVFALKGQSEFIQWGALAGGLAIAIVLFFLSESGKILALFMRDSWREAKKVVWPQRNDTFKLTGYVFVFCLVMAIFLWATDKSLEFLFYDLLLHWKKG